MADQRGDPISVQLDEPMSLLGLEREKWVRSCWQKLWWCSSNCTELRLVSGELYPQAPYTAYRQLRPQESQHLLTAWGSTLWICKFLGSLTLLNSRSLVSCIRVSAPSRANDSIGRKSAHSCREALGSSRGLAQVWGSQEEMIMYAIQDILGVFSERPEWCHS